ncbi:MAG: YfhO family protein [Lachnospiraceae bacterium]|nr:YfhO family protein [Lachnospiraceae bacterium]
MVSFQQPQCRPDHLHHLFRVLGLKKTHYFFLIFAGRGPGKILCKPSVDLFTSIPYDDGWTIKRNGDKITPVLFENCLICIPLRNGENHIQMTYTAPGLRPGIVLSILDICALAAAAAPKRHSFRSRGNR